MQKIRMHPSVQFLALILLCLLLGSGAAVASHKPGHMMEGHHGMAHGGKGGTWGMDMFAYVPMAILFQKDLLGLSNEQVQKIESIKQQMRQARSDHEAIEKIHEQMAEALKGGQFDLSAYESALKKAADYVVQARIETARKAQDALQVLDKDQRTRFLYSMQVMHKWMAMRHVKHRGHGMDQEDMDEDAAPAG